MSAIQLRRLEAIPARRGFEPAPRLPEMFRAPIWGVLVAGRAIGYPARFHMNPFAFSETQRRHLAWTNAVILPRARTYLTAGDHSELGRRMAARRGMEING